VLGSPGLNPYKLGKELWEYVENVANRREVVTALLRIDGVTWQNFHDTVDFDRVREYLEPTPPLDSITQETLPDLTELDQSKLDGESLDRALDGEIDVERHPWKVLSHDGLAERHFSLTRPRNHGFIEAVGPERLEEVDRYLFDDDRHASVEAALDEVAYTAGWDRLFEVRESHNDVTFLDEFLTPEFVRQNGYFTHEYSHAAGESRVASTDPEDVRKNLLLEFANFG
jgi:stage V sporulation protein R